MENWGAHHHSDKQLVLADLAQGFAATESQPGGAEQGALGLCR